MIPTHSFTSGLDYIDFTWERPQYRPERYQLTYLCIIKSCMPKTPISDFLNVTLAYVSSDTTAISIRDLRPNTICVLKFVAVYNPASSDSGLVITARTLADNISKCIATYGIFHDICAFISELYVSMVLSK